MRWLIENAKDKRDKLKNFRGFERAWREVFDDVPCFSGAGGEEAKAVCCVKLMEIFLRMRENARLEKDAARQRKKRAKISAPSTRQTKSMPDS
jgi:hypothetical protein